MKPGVREGRRGNATVEFTIFGILIIFILIATFELSWSMWIYETLAYALKDTARYAAVHGQMCVSNSAGCTLTVDQLASRLQYAGVGLLPNKLSVEIKSQTRTYTCNPLQKCIGNTDCFPAAVDCTATLEIGGMQGMPVTITGSYSFGAGIWAGKVIPFVPKAMARENIQF